MMTINKGEVGAVGTSEEAVMGYLCGGMAE
jgi:hypothetical protein